MPPYVVWRVQKDLEVFKKARHLFHVGQTGSSPPLTKSVIPSFPFILTFWLKYIDYQVINNERISPHPCFSRASQVPSQSAFSTCPAGRNFINEGRLKGWWNDAHSLPKLPSTGRLNGWWKEEGRNDPDDMGTLRKGEYIKPCHGGFPISHGRVWKIILAEW